MAAGLGPVSAFAATQTYNFGSIGADGGSVCGSNCVLPNKVEHAFNNGSGLNLGAIGYNASAAEAYVTQKPGAIDGPGETGLGESNTFPSPSDSDYEITDSTYLLLDDAAVRAAGYSVSSIQIESIQNGEGAKIYGYTGTLGGTLNTADLVLLDTITNPPNPVTTTVNISSSQQYNYYVVRGDTPPGGSLSADVAVSQEVFTSSAVPEPSTWAMLLVGFAGLGFAGYRSRTPISIV